MTARRSTHSIAPGLGVIAALILGSTGRAAPPAEEAELNLALVGGTHALGPSESGAISAWERRPLGFGHLAWDVGLQAERTRLPDFPPGPALFQDYAAILSLEAFEGDEAGASLTLLPGWYYASRFTSAAWDVPAILDVGVPLGGAWSAVVGFENGRFWHHAMPIAGVVWSHPKFRVEATLPEPAITWWIAPRRSLRLGGELDGDGHLGDPAPTRTAIEYSSYRIGLTYEMPLDGRLRLKGSAGIEAAREIDAFRAGRDRRGGGGAYLKLALSAQSGAVNLTRP